MIFFRPYEDKDKPVIEEMELIEGVKKSGMCFEDNPTMVLLEDQEILGFFTLRKQHNFPMLQHFCIKRGKRTPELARLLIKGFKKVMQELGFNKVIIPSKEEYLEKMIQYYFKTKPYASTKRAKYFLVKV